MELASYFDHTLLKPDTATADIRRLCAEAIDYKFAAVCVPPFFVPEAVQTLENYPVKVATVIGFPMGYSATPAKVEEIKRAIDEGVDELDVVINLCAVKNGNFNFVRSDIDSMTMAAHSKRKSIKVILETSMLSSDEIKHLCDICNELQVDFVKTSTGMNGGATPEVVALLRSYLNKQIKIKASGGIRTFFDAQQMIAAGAVRLGSSSSVQIMQQQG
jgi:deoxyribose-phosphate aldolase